MRTTTLLFFVLSIYNLNAQNADTETIDGNNVSGIVADEGYFFNNFQNSTQGYEVPAGAGAGTIYAAGIWAGGLDINGQLHLTAPNGSVAGWRSGPIADNISYGTVAYQNAYSTSIWKVTRQQVDDHIAQYQQGGYTPVAAISDWPGNGDVSMGVADQLAPYVDLNADGVYDPLDGDYPEFPGDQVVYVIQNDESYLPQPNNLGVELHLMFYQFNDNGYLSETTFLNVQAFNRSTTNYYDFKLSIYADFDIGNPTDDYFGSSVTNNMMYAYNGDSYDETIGGTIGYEDNPPCQGIMSLNHTLYAANRFNSFSFFPTAPPTTNLEHWNFMNGLWADGSPMFYGGDGYNAGVSTTSTKIIYPGESDPLGLATWGTIVNGDWGEYNSNGGTPNFPSERQGLMSISPGDFPVATTICADFVFLFNDTDVDPLNNVQNVLNIADALQILYDSSSDFPCGYLVANTPELDPLEFNVFPNPSSGSFSLQLSNGFDPVIVEVRDVTGRLMYSKVTQDELTQIQLDAPAGVYQVSVQSAHSRVTKSIVVQ